MNRPSTTDDRPVFDSGSCGRRAVLGGITSVGAAAALPVSSARKNQRQSDQRSPEGPLSDPDAFESFVDDLLTEQLEEHSIAGATVSVVDGDRTFAKGYGYSDVANREQVTAADTLFRIGSVSKLFGWTLAMQAVERGEINLDTDINQYLGDVELPETFEEPITLDHLATHTAGFEERFRGVLIPSDQEVPPLETILREEQPSRVRPPGEFTTYSNFGAGVASYAAANAFDSTFEEAVQQAIFEPLGMSRSTFSQPVPENLRPSLSKGYSASDDTLLEGEFEHIGIPAAGSMSTTGVDMARFMRAHLNQGAIDSGRILRPESVTAMHQQRFTNDDRLNGMCFGFFEMDRNGERVIGHAGDTNRFHSLLFLLPEREVGFFVSYNTSSGTIARDELTDAFFDQYYPTSESSPTVPSGPPDRASGLTGTYHTLRRPVTTSEKIMGIGGTTVSVNDSGYLVTSPLEGESRRWVQTEPLFFEAVDGQDKLAFRESGGEITHIFFDSRPVSSYGRISTLEKPQVHAIALISSLLVFLSAIVGWPAAAAWRRYRDGTNEIEPLARWGRWVAGVAALSFVGFMFTFFPFMLMRPEKLFLGDPLLMRSFLVLAKMGVLATAVSVGIAVVAWRDEYWGVRSRLHHSLVVLAGVVVTTVLIYWNLVLYQM